MTVEPVMAEVSTQGYDPSDPHQRADIAWDMPEELRRSVLHYVAWSHPEAFADAVADAMRNQADKDRFHVAYWAGRDVS